MDLQDELVKKYLSLQVGKDIPASPSSLPYAHERGGFPINKYPVDILKKNNFTMVSYYVNQRIDEYQNEIDDLNELYVVNKKRFGNSSLSLEDRADARGAIKIIKRQLSQKEGKITQLEKNLDFAKTLLFAKINFALVPNNIYFLFKEPDDSLRLQLLSPNEISNSGFVAAIKVLADYTLKPIYLLNN